MVDLAKEQGISAQTLHAWVKRYGVPARASAQLNGAANGTHAKPSAPVLAVRAGAPVNPVLALAQAKELLNGVAAQLDAVAGAFEAFQSFFGTVPVPVTGSGGTA
jgi:hypothetical protein